MKKVFYSIAIVSAMMFASCSEDRGKTYETADANQDENVNQSHIRGNETAAGTSTTGTANSDAAWRGNSERVAGQMATDMRLDTPTQNRVQQVLYERERRLGELEFNYDETSRMGGQVAERVDNMATTERDRYDTDGGTMTDIRANTNSNTNAQNNTTAASDLDTQREQIMKETDRELQSILSQEQYREYQEKRANYWGLSNDGTNQLDNSGTIQNQNQMNNNNQMNNSGTNNNQSGSNSNAGNNMNRNQ